jgi:hypothetical protein
MVSFLSKAEAQWYVRCCLISLLLLTASLFAQQIDSHEPTSSRSLIYAEPGASLARLCDNFDGTVVITVPLSIESDTTLPPTCTIQVAAGGSINVTSSHHMVIAGSLDAGLRRIFTGTGAVYFYGGNGPKEVYPQWWGAMGNAKSGGWYGTAGNRILNTIGHNPWSVGDVVTVVGGGSGGSNYSTTVTAVTGTYPFRTVTVATAPLTTVSSSNPQPIYNVDDSAALVAWAASVRSNFAADGSNGYLYPSTLGTSVLYAPKGQYNVCTTPITVYNGTVWTAAAANISSSALFIQCNPQIPVINVSADNYAPNGTRSQQGNGVSTFYNFNASSAFPTGSGAIAPIVQFYNASNVVSDTRFYSPFFEAIDGDAFAMGFQTTGSISNGSKTLAVANGITLLNGETIVVVGAGVGGANLNAQVAAGGGTNSLTLTSSASTTVASALVYPATDFYGILIHHAELDVSQAGHFINVGGNASGSITVDDSEIFLPFHGAVKISSLSPFGLQWNNVACFGCGNYNFTDAPSSYAIYANDASASHSSDVLITSSYFEGVQGSLTDTTGGVFAQGYRTFKIAASTFIQPDNHDSAIKGIASSGNFYVDIQGNTMSSTGLEAGAFTPNLVQLSGTAALTATIQGNSFSDSKLIGIASGTVLSGTTALTIANGAKYAPTQTIYIPGAGSSGRLYIGRVVSFTPPTLTVAPATSTTVMNPRIFGDFANAISVSTAPLAGDLTGNVFSGNIYRLGSPMADALNFKTLTASLTTTAATTDVVPMLGMTPEGHCTQPAATNSEANKNKAITFVSAKAEDQITVTHNATAGMTYDLSCTPY